MLRRLALVLVAVGLVALPACSTTPSGIELTAYFDKAVSLYEKGDVKILGLSSGKVTEVEVIDTKVRVKMRLNGGTNVPADVQATIVPLSLIGERYVQLFPAWTHGEPTAKDGAVIPLERTSVPVEPDEGLAALKKFLDTLDPNATGRLVKNLAADLKGNGQRLNDALGQFAQLTTTLAEKDEQLAHLIENFDKFTATLRTREVQLGRVMDQFAQTTDLLADERDTVARLIKALAQTSSAGLDLVSEHGGALNADVQTLTDTLITVNTNLQQVRDFLTATPMLVAGVNLDGKQGLLASFDPNFKHIDLRQSTTPTLALLLTALGLPAEGVCLPIDVECEPSIPLLSSPTAASPGRGASQPASAEAPAPPAASTAAPTAASSGPVDDLVDLLTSDGHVVASTSTYSAAKKRSNPFARAARWFGEVFG